MRRAHLGKMFDVKRMRSPEAAARLRAFGFCTSIGPIPVWIARTGSCPWRTTRRRPSGSTSSAVEARDVSNSTSTAWAINRRAPVSQNFGEWIVDCPFLSKGNNSILGHGVTLLLGGSGGLITNPVTPPSSHRHPVSCIAPTWGEMGRSTVPLFFDRAAKQILEVCRDGSQGGRNEAACNCPVGDGQRDRVRRTRRI